MATEFLMPMLGEVMEEGKVITWHKKVGDHVERGEVMLEVETDKATMEVESTATGVINEIFVSEGETVPVNTKLALIE